MRFVLTGGTVFNRGKLANADICIGDGLIVPFSAFDGRLPHRVINISNCIIVPGFVDVHVHLREPGFFYKESIASGTAAAAAGGYTDVCAMPNLSPVPDSLSSLRVQLDIIERTADIRVHPYGAISCGERGERLSDMAAMAPYVCGFSDDGRGVQSRELMIEAMLTAKKLDKPISAHCEDESLLKKGWSVHDGGFAKAHGLIGNPSESEWKQVERDLELVRETGCRYHVCHVSTKESVELIRRAKQEGLPISCETAPHYLLLTDADLRDSGSFCMNPPIRSAEDREALIAGLNDGTIEVIATDHAPHSAEEKSGGLAGSLNGIVGLECAFPVLYEGLVKPGIVPLETVLSAMTDNPRRLFGLKSSEIEAGNEANLTVISLDSPHVIDAGRFISKGHATPFDGQSVSAEILLTVCGGRIVYCAEGLL